MYALPFAVNSTFKFLIALQWKQDANLREIKVMRRYHIQDREDYHKCVISVVFSRYANDKRGSQV